MKKMFLTFIGLSVCASAMAQDEASSYMQIENGDTVRYLTPNPPANDDEFKEVVFADVYEGNYENFLIEAQRYLKVNPQSVVGRYLSGVANYMLGNDDEAFDDLLYAFEKDYTPEKYAYPVQYLMGYVDSQPEKIIRTLEPLGTRIAGDADKHIQYYNTQVLLGHSYGSLGKWGTVARVYAPRAIAAVPKEEDEYFFFNALNLEANALNNSGHPEKALEVYNRPEWTDSVSVIEHQYFVRSLALRNVGLIDSAITYMEDVIRKVPDNDDYLMHYATLLSAAGRQDEAIATFTKIMEDNEHIVALGLFADVEEKYCEALLRRGIALEMSGDSEGARADYLSLLEMDPENLAALSRLGRREDIMKLLERDEASNSEIILAMVYSNLGDDEKALTHLGNAFAEMRIIPQAIPYDPNFKRLIAHPAYKDAVARFNFDE